MHVGGGGKNALAVNLEHNWQYSCSYPVVCTNVGSGNNAKNSLIQPITCHNLTGGIAVENSVTTVEKLGLVPLLHHGPEMVDSFSNSSTSADTCFDALSLSLLLSQSLSVEKHTKCIPQVNVSDLVT